MNKPSYKLNRQQLADAQQALDIAAFNGLAALAVALKKRGLLEPAEIDQMHEAMSKPLSAAKNANNPAVQDAQQNLSSLFALLRQSQ